MIIYSTVDIIKLYIYKLRSKVKTLYKKRKQNIEGRDIYINLAARLIDTYYTLLQF